MKVSPNRGFQYALSVVILVATGGMGWLSTEAAHGYEGMSGISPGWGQVLSVVALALILVASIVLLVLQELERRRSEIRQVDRRNTEAQIHAGRFRQYAKLVQRGEHSSRLDGFIEGLLTDLSKQLSNGGKMDVRVCYYVQEVYEEDKGMDDSIPEYLQYVCASNSSSSPRLQFSTKTDVGFYVISALREGKHLQYPDVTDPSVPVEIRNDPLYRDRPRKYGGFLSLPVCDPSRSGNARLVGMLTVDFEGTDRATNSDLKLALSYENILTSALISAQSPVPSMPHRPLIGLEG